MSGNELQILTLTVTGGQAAQLGSRKSKSFCGENGNIGRSEDCSWVLSSSGISRVHAMIHYLNGLYFVEDRSTNGMQLNGAPLLKGDPAALKDGDVMRIDAFDISVKLQQAATAPEPPALSANPWPDAGSPLPASMLPSPPAPPAPPPQPAASEMLDFGLGPAESMPMPASAPAPAPMGGMDAGFLDSLIPDASRAPAANSGGLIPDSVLGNNGLIPDAAPGNVAELDPLSFLDAPFGSEPAPSSVAPQSGPWTHSAGTSDFFRPPSTDVQRQAGMLPDDWDPLAPEAPAAAPARPSAPAPAPMQPAASPRMQPQAPAWPTPAAQPAAPPQMQPQAPAPLRPAAPVAHPQPAAQPTPPQAAPPAWPSAAAPAAPVAPVAPVAPASAVAISPVLDAVFRIVVDGVMDVLRARAEIKNTFRLPVTVIQKSENNPLKFAMGVDEAMQKIMAPPNPAFLSGPAAFDDAFDDIRCHQMAMLAGVRAGFDSLLRHFDPENFEREADAAGRHTFGGKGRYWDRFREHYSSLAGDPDECFRRLFGDEFARAYEEQLARLKSARHARGAGAR